MAMSMELERRSIDQDTEPAKVKRGLELSAYFTKANLELPHRKIALSEAMRLAHNRKNFASAANYATRFLALNPNGSGKPIENVCNPIPSSHLHYFNNS